MADENRLPMDEFVNKLVPDPSNPPDTLLLSGFLGSSSEEGYTRLYFDPQLSAYVEIPTAAILHTQPLPKEQSPLGGSYLWVRRDAELIHGKVGAQQRPKAKFFEGPIMQEFMQGQPGVAQPGATPGGMGQAPMALQSQFGPCPSQLIVACQPTLLCPSQQINCQSVATPCITQPQVCRTIQPPCPSIFAPCPSQQFPCPSQQIPCLSQQIPCVSQQAPCPSIQNPCPSLLTPCLSQQIPCPSQQAPCPSFQNPCPSVQQICPSQPICPSTPPGCPTGFVCPSQGNICPSAVDGCPSQFCASVSGCASQQCGPLGPQGFGQMQPQQQQFFPSRFSPQCPFPSQQAVCPSLIDGCPSQQVICQSAVTCPSQAVICQSVVCPSQQVVCQSVVCPSQQVICQSAVTCPSQAVICQSLACPSQAVICQSLVCPSQAVVCHSLACPSQAVLCQSLVCPSFAGCPSLACGPGGGGQFGGQAQGFGQFFPSQGGQQCPIPSMWYGQCRSWADGCPSQFCPQV